MTEMNIFLTDILAFNWNYVQYIWIQLFIIDVLDHNIKHFLKKSLHKSEYSVDFYRIVREYDCRMTENVIDRQWILMKILQPWDYSQRLAMSNSDRYLINMAVCSPILSLSLRLWHSFSTCKQSLNFRDWTFYCNQLT